MQYLFFKDYHLGKRQAIQNVGGRILTTCTVSFRHRTPICESN